MPEGFFHFLRNIVFFVAIYLYFAGWLYVFYFLNQFGISLSSMDIPFYYFFIYSYPVFAENRLWTVFIFVGLLLVLGYTIKFVKNNQKRKYLLYFVPLLLFPIIFLLSKDSAEIVAIKMRSGAAKKITFLFKDQENLLTKQMSDRDSTFFEANHKSKLRLLTQTKDRFIVFYQPPGESNQLPYAYAYVVFNSDIVLAKISLQNTPRWRE